MPESGYSGTPLAKKLGIGSGCRVHLRGAPDGYPALLALLAPLPPGVAFDTAVDARTDVVHLFVDEKAQLAAELAALRQALRSDAAVWVSWPKKASKRPTDITENTVRALALPMGFVDIKVCAIDGVWSALKLVVRRELRQRPSA